MKSKSLQSRVLEIEEERKSIRKEVMDDLKMKFDYYQDYAKKVSEVTDREI